MHIGQSKEIVPCHHDKWIPGIGRIPAQVGVAERILESYQCESCGAIVKVLGRAVEQFYCQCQALIGID